MEAVAGERDRAARAARGAELPGLATRPLQAAGMAAAPLRLLGGSEAVGGAALLARGASGNGSIVSEGDKSTTLAPVPGLGTKELGFPDDASFMAHLDANENGLGSRYQAAQAKFQQLGPEPPDVNSEQHKAWDQVPEFNALIQRIRSGGQLVAYNRPAVATGVQTLVKSLDVYRESDDKRGMVLCLAGLACVAEAEGQSDRAVRLFATVERWLQSVGMVMSRADQVEVDRSMRAVCDVLSEETFAAVQVEGRAMSLEQAIAYALRTDG